MKTAEYALELAAPWERAVEGHSVAAASVREWWDSTQRVFPANTLRAWRSDWQIYDAFCAERDVTTVPATPATVAAFVDACGEVGKKPATIRRYLTTIALAHRVAKFPNPCAEEPVRHALKGLTNEVSVAQRQAKGLGWEQIKIFVETAGEGLPATRERALLCVAYDTMARRSELVALNRGDLRFLEDGSGRALIKRSKTDQAGESHTAYLAPITVRYLKAWLEMAQISQGGVFRRLIGTGFPP
jgi:integrase